MNTSRKNRFALPVLAAALLVAGIAPSLQAGAVGGPQFNYGEPALAYSTDTYRIWFYGGELAEVLVIGDHDTDLDLMVYDEFGNLVASDLNFTDVCLAQWFPTRTGEFRIEVINRGSVHNVYDLVTN
jgi:hypothetical protein